MRTAVCLVSLMMAACSQQEKRQLEPTPVSAQSAQAGVRESGLYPGGFVPLTKPHNPYADNQDAINRGQKLWKQMNCSGCHASGGGAIGPPLIDADWIYGSDDASIFESIVKGRANGMPSFAGKLPEDQVWQLVSYVKSIRLDEPSEDRLRTGERK